MSVAGLVGVEPIADSVTTGEFDVNAPVADADTKQYTVTVPAGTVAARFYLDAADDTADLDLYLGGELVDLSASSAADEQVTLLDPADGTYDVFVNGFTTPGGSTTYDLANFVVAPTDRGNLTLSPPRDPPAVRRLRHVSRSLRGSGASRREGRCAPAAAGRRGARRRGSRRVPGRGPLDCPADRGLAADRGNLDLTRLHRRRRHAATASPTSCSQSENCSASNRSPSE